MENSVAIYSLMDQAIRVKATPGVSYLISGKNEREQHILGYQDYEQNPLTEQSIYDIASLTKVVAITTRILQLLGKGSLSLSTKVGEFWPNLEYRDVTIENLLLHNSGLIADLPNIYDYTSKDAVIKAVLGQKLIYPTGQNMVYSDLNFILLGLIIEKVDGLSLDLSIKENVFKPLQMNSTGYNLQADLKRFVPTEVNKVRGLVRGKVHDETAFQLNGVSGNAGVFSTLADLANFCQMYQNHGIFEEREIIPEKMIDQLFAYNFMGRTLGWQRWDTTSKKLWHTGFTGTSIALDLDKGNSFICLTNCVYPTRDNQQWLPLRRLAVSLFFGKTEVLP